MTSRGLLLAAFCLAQPVAADPAAFLDQLLAGPEKTEHADAFVEAFAERMGREPRVNRPSRLFRSSTAAPLAFTTELQQADWLGSAPWDVWAQQFSISSDCPEHEAALPTTLEAAAEAIEAGAMAAQASLRGMLPERDWRRLEKDFDRVLGYLAHPQPAALSWSEKRRLRRFLDRVDKADLKGLYCAAQLMEKFASQAWLAAVQSLMAEHPQAGAALIHARATPLGQIVFAGRANTVHRGDDVLALYDLGGDDIHAMDITGHFDGRPRLLVDFAGDDRYETTAPGGIGGAVGRVSLLIDVDGDDRYLGSSLSQGAAILGAAFVHDRGGHDEYLAQNLSQGIALAGVGVLRDDAGNDRYQLRSMGQGLGMFAGLGMLRDGAGDDRYRALGGRTTLYGDAGLSDAWAQGVGLGLRGMSTGGIGVLVDEAGNDQYDAGVFAQGGGYYRGTGILLDQGSGDDLFTGTRYALGWGAHGGLGYFENAKGDDKYHTRHSVMAGLAWDYSLAWFHDRAGNDEYRVGDFSLGASAHHSTAIFVDTAGSDRYFGTQPARSDQGTPNIGLFIDSDARGDLLDGVPPEPGCQLADELGFTIWRQDDEAPRCSRN